MKRLTKSGEVEKKRGGLKAKKVRKKKKSKFDNIDHPYLHPELQLLSRYDEVADISSYVDQLSEEEKQWLNSFTAEYVCADFRHGGEIVNKTIEDRSIAWDKNNSRNRCIYSREKSASNLSYLEDVEEVEDTDKELDEYFELDQGELGEQ